VFAIVLAALSVTIQPNFLDGVEGYDYTTIEHAFTVAKYVGIFAGLAVILIEISGLLSFCLWSREIQIAFIVGMSLLVTFLLSAGVWIANPIVNSTVSCDYISANCYQCTAPSSPTTCAANGVLKPCWVYESTYKFVCKNHLLRAEATVALMLVLVIFQFIAAILACIGLRHVEEKGDEYNPIMTYGKYSK